MASTTCPQTSFLSRGRKVVHETRGRRISCVTVRVFSTNKSEDTDQPRKAPPGVDTRIHWDSPDEGWIGGSDNSPSSDRPKIEEEQQQDLLGDKFADLINSTNSHYQFLGVPMEADLEEIKAAYRRLSKEYHPDTTTLPLIAASEKFMKLREVYNILSNAETRRFYDWTLAQEAASLRAEKLKVKFEDPYEQELKNYVSIPDTVDRLKGKNLKLSDQAMTALTVDAAILVFTICCIVFVIFFKEPY
ncbi:NAD(P)H-quinone oxidoreductase subunit T protein [Thalictrum thalictroides]|uniref:NAD(P)H-quinone oxidoreductase subunit T protein n=1 Tax=Thalictrum thalictroides TaxID=46969 RepID=A0A7J6WX04_THATH|nr:NAD(P)H-quinone oxidoreductase subunit T protein [Thalictrum thalictroides]